MKVAALGHLRGKCRKQPRLIADRFEIIGGALLRGPGMLCITHHRKKHQQKDCATSPGCSHIVFIIYTRLADITAWGPFLLTFYCSVIPSDAQQELCDWSA